MFLSGTFTPAEALRQIEIHCNYAAGLRFLLYFPFWASKLKFITEHFSVLICLMFCSFHVTGSMIAGKRSGCISQVNSPRRLSLVFLESVTYTLLLN